MSEKKRLSASVDGELIAAAEHAVRLGDVPTVSAWVNDAMRLKLAQDGRLRAMAAFLADYEAEHGEITQEEMDAAQREAKRRAISVRGLRAGESRKRFGR